MKGIRWDESASYSHFFESLEEAVQGLADADDTDEMKRNFFEEMRRAHYYRLDKFKLKIGHKNLIINLCHELKSVKPEEFNAPTVVYEEPKQIIGEFVVRNIAKPAEPTRSVPSHSSPFKRRSEDEPTEEIQYEVCKEDEGGDHEYLEESELYGTEEYEMKAEDIEDDGLIYNDQIIAYETEHFSNEVEFETVYNRSRKNKRPRHMYTEEFLQTQASQGRIGVPGRRRPKLQKRYPNTEEGMLERWSDLVRQSCKVIVPKELLGQHTLDHIDLSKTSETVWEVKCPLCTKKLRLQLTQEGKYQNYKRSNFERHLRIVHYKQIKQFKNQDTDGEEDPYDNPRNSE